MVMMGMKNVLQLAALGVADVEALLIKRIGMQPAGVDQSDLLGCIEKEAYVYKKTTTKPNSEDKRDYFLIQRGLFANGSEDGVKVNMKLQKQMKKKRIVSDPTKRFGPKEIKVQSMDSTWQAKLSYTRVDVDKSKGQSLETITSMSEWPEELRQAVVKQLGLICDPQAYPEQQYVEEHYYDEQQHHETYQQQPVTPRFVRWLEEYVDLNTTKRVQKYFADQKRGGRTADRLAYLYTQFWGPDAANKRAWKDVDRCINESNGASDVNCVANFVVDAYNGRFFHFQENDPEYATEWVQQELDKKSRGDGLVTVALGDYEHELAVAYSKKWCVLLQSDTAGYDLSQWLSKEKATFSRTVIARKVTQSNMQGVWSDYANLWEKYGKGTPFPCRKYTDVLGYAKQLMQKTSGEYLRNTTVLWITETEAQQTAKKQWSADSFHKS